MPHATLAICDLNATVAAKDEIRSVPDFTHTQICLLAQFAKRITGKEVEGSTSNAAQLVGEEEYNFQTNGLEYLVCLFDISFIRDWTNIAKIRRALPLDVEYKYVAH